MSGRRNRADGMLNVRGSKLLGRRDPRPVVMTGKVFLYAGGGPRHTGRPAGADRVSLAVSVRDLSGPED